RAPRTHTSAEALAIYQATPPSDLHAPAGQYTLAGRIRAIRVMGKAAFAHIEDAGGKIQLYFRANDLGDKFKLFVDNFDLGDFIAATGGLFTTKTGEVTLWVSGYQLLAKALSPLP